MSDRVLACVLAKRTAISDFTVQPLGSNLPTQALGVAVISVEPVLRGQNNPDAGQILRVGDLDGQQSFPAIGSDAELGLAVVPRNLVWNGNGGWDRLRSASAAVLATQRSIGAALVSPPGQWTQIGDPALAAQAIATRPALGVRHVCTGIVATLAAGAAAAGPIKVYLRDGASGGGAILWVGSLSAPANGVGVLQLSGLCIMGTNNSAMTLEFAAAGPAGSQQSVTLIGHSTT